MFNFQMLGFAVVAAVAGVGVDYHQQSLKAEQELGEMTAGAYFQTISGRFSDFQAEKAAKVEEKERKSRVRAGARLYLPEAPEGWARREWAAGDNSQISAPPRENSEEVDEMLEASSFLRNMAAKSEKEAAAAKNSQTWVYERGDEVVSVRARLTEMPTDNSMSSNAMTMVIGNMNALAVREGWGVIGGVAYSRTTSFGADEERPYQILNAVLGFGVEVKIDVRTNTSDDATREILSRIDYDGLNALLPRPLAHVGKGAPEVDPIQEVALAERMIEIREDLIQKRTNAAEAWMQSAGSPGGAMTLALRQAGFNIEGSMGEADAELDKALAEIIAKGEANPDDQAALDAESGEEPVKTAANNIADDSPATPPTGRQLYSKPLPQDKIDSLQVMSDSDRSMAMIGLELAVRKFEAKNGLPKGACEFSMVNYRVECSTENKQAKAQGVGGIFGLLAGDDAESKPAPQKAPKRLQLSGGKSCLENSQGSFCN